MTVKTNIGGAVQVILQQLPTAADTDKMLRTCATTVLDLMKKRVFQNGLDSNGQQIGVYSARYMKVRTGRYGNAKVAKKGLKAGAVTHAGVFTKGRSKGAPRPRYNRTGDTKVIGSLTRQMENDMRLLVAQNGGYAIGFRNNHNYKKSQWLEATYKKPIFLMSAAEQQAVKVIANAVP